MHNAPPVAYPVGRFVWGPRLMGLLLTLSGGGLVAWQSQSHTTTTLVWGAWLFWALCAGVALYTAPQQWLSEGQLLWTGEVWLWQGASGQAVLAEEDVVLAVSVGLDMGSWMLVWVQATSAQQPGAGPMQCAWVSKQSQPSKWHGFRCAVYSRPKAVANAQVP